MLSQKKSKSVLFGTDGPDGVGDDVPDDVSDDVPEGMLMACPRAC